MKIESVSEKHRKSKAKIVTLENAASKFPSFIMPSIQKANFVKEVQKYPRIEEDLFASCCSSYILDLDKSTNPDESIRVWIGALYQMQVTTKLDNISIFVLVEKRMTRIIYDSWIGSRKSE